MPVIYTKTALKKIKKDDLIEMYLSQQQKMSQLWLNTEKLQAGLDKWVESHAKWVKRAALLKEENKKLKEENEKLAETADDTPDQCEICDKRFDLHYTMNQCDGNLRDKYDDYFGSEKDQGDVCPDCINTIC